MSGELPCEGDPIERTYTEYEYNPYTRRDDPVTRHTPGTGTDVKVKKEDFEEWLKGCGSWPLPPGVPLAAWYDTGDQVERINTSPADRSEHERHAELVPDVPAFNSAQENPLEKIIYYKDGDIWVIGTPGNEFQFKDSKGLSRIHKLLNAPNEEKYFDKLGATRSSVTTSIGKACTKIGKNHKCLGGYLEKAIRTGKYFQYVMATPICRVLEKPR